MGGLQKIEHVEYTVTDLDRAARFYEESLALLRLDAGPEHIAYFGCGLDETFDVAVTEGGTGVDHVAIRVDSPDELEAYEEQLSEATIETRRTDEEEPGQSHGLRFSLPSGLQLELVVVDPGVPYHRSSHPAINGRKSIAPIDLDHFNYLSPMLDADVDVLVNHLDFKLSEILGPREEPRGAFLRRGDYHHDIGILVTDKTPPTHAGMHHVAWKVSGIDHMKTLIDQIASTGIRLESGPSRHLAGDNIYSYFWEPGGNRFELCTEMSTVSTDETVHVDLENTFSVWDGDPPPESWARGSGLALARDRDE